MTQKQIRYLTNKEQDRERAKLRALLYGRTKPKRCDTLAETEEMKDALE